MRSASHSRPANLVLRLFAQMAAHRSGAVRLSLVLLLVLIGLVLPAACSRAERAGDFPISAYRGADVLGGETVMLSSLFAKQPIVLNFWAGLCPPCRAEMPDFQELSKEYEGRVLIVGVDLGPFVRLGTHEDGRKLVEELRITYPTGYTDDRSVPSRYQVLGMPSTFFIKPDGTIQQKWLGFMSRKHMEEHVERLIQD
ncbi:MAG: TlpA family protein disulfide reductase [SAR202 cluster bacterium]|nr:TlpA family protein disulfide reductase [SAR202 cluster bacterium]